MGKQKSRNVYSVENFRGLDKENKPLKVEHFRAADGENFIIDSGTLKTRPAFRYLGETLFHLEENEEILGWFVYRNIKIFVTNKHFRFEKDGSFFSEDDPQDVLVTNIEQPLNFEGKEPLFREEKDALFIFGLGSVFVFSYFENKAILYDIRNKPSTNPFSILNEDVYKRFEDLPTPYVPTLFIGDTRFDDINLLSDSFRYKVFSQSQRQKGDERSYFLPTHFKEETHGGFDVDIDFYNGRLDNVDVVPVFMGVEDEDFDASEKVSKYGTPLEINGVSLEDTPLTIEQTLLTSNAFVVIRDQVNQTDEYASKFFSITPNVFFSLRMLGGQSVFEYLIGFFEENQAEIDTWTENKYLVFSLNYEAKKIIKDKETNFVIKEENYTDSVKVYVQARKFSVLELASQNQGFASATNKAHDLSKPYPPIYGEVLSLEVGGGHPENKILNLNDDNGEPFPIKVNNFNMSNFDTMVNSLIQNNKSQLEGVENVLVNAKFFAERNGQYNYGVGNLELVAISDVETDPSSSPSNPGSYIEITAQDLEDFTGYPVSEENIGVMDFMPPPGSLEVSNELLQELHNFNVSVIHGYSLPMIQQFAELDTWLKTDVLDVLMNRVDKPTNGYVSGHVFYLARIYSVSPYNTRTLVFRVPFTEEHEGDYQERWFVQRMVKLLPQIGLTKEHLWQFDFSPTRNAFELKVKDYFFDYNNEPSIVVKTRFHENPDFEKIAAMRFGVAFGSEDRLFLAGDKNHPNIDRFNVSNDLLGGNKKSQSYELSYFPSRNYRVLGGQGAINGYVVATDSQLYVTKEHAPNDDNFYIRERRLSDEGQVTYFESKTNINQTPLNHRCLIRFYNDILILSDQGLYAVEIASNVLTNERLVKLRSSFVNKEMVEQMNLVPHEKVFVIQNNEYMYIFVGKVAYVADSRYIAENPNGKVDNLSYEIVRWFLPFGIKSANFLEGKPWFLSEEEEVFYTLKEKDQDEVFIRREDFLSCFKANHPPHTTLYNFNVCIVSQEDEFILEEPEKYRIRVYDGIMRFASLALFAEYHLVGGDYNKIYIDNDEAFKFLEEGDKFLVKEGDDLVELEVLEFASDRSYFLVNGSSTYDYDNLYINIEKRDLFITHIFEFFFNDELVKGFRLSPLKTEEIIVTDYLSGYNPVEWNGMLQNDFEQEDVKYNLILPEGMQDVVINKPQDIYVRWLSNVTSFGNDLMEKTIFRTNIYASKFRGETSIQFGYKTMRSVRDEIVGDKEGIAPKPVTSLNVASTFDFETMNFDLVSLHTFGETGSSIPMKENNFLYIQFALVGRGRIQVNGFRVIFKFNRRLKTVG